jgi:hypothetical protein
MTAPGVLLEVEELNASEFSNLKLLMAVALWDGALKEINANKRVSFWQELKF